MTEHDHAVLVLGGKGYRWLGCGLGAQLESMEWRMPAPGTERVLAGHRFRVFGARRQGLLCRVSWGLCVGGCWDEVQAKIRLVEADMRKLV